MKSTLPQSTLECLPRFIGLSYSDCDCWELVKLFYLNVFGIDLNYLNEDYDNPLAYKVVSRFMEINKAKLNKVEKPKFGDILLLQVKGYNAHLGIFLNKEQFLHTTKETGSVIDRFSTWKCKLEGYYRYGKD